MTSWEKYGDKARDWTTVQYADSRGYLAARAELVVALGPRLDPGDTVLDLACGDGGLEDFLPGCRYIGVDASPEMVEAGHARGRDVHLADINAYLPPAPVQATTIFRAIYYAQDRVELLRRIAGYTEKKLVFDLNPRQFRLDDVRADLREAGFGALALHPFFVPQTHSLPGVVASGIRLLEQSGPVARLLLRYRFTLLCAASVK